MAELTDLRALGFSGRGDSGFGAFGDQAPGGFQRVGFVPQGGLFGTIAKIGGGLIKKLVGGGSTKLSAAAKAAKRAAKAAAQSPAVRAGAAAAAGTVVGANVPLPGSSVAVQAAQAQFAGGAPVAMVPRAPSIIVDSMGRAWRRAGTPVLWSGDLTAVRRVNKAAARARRASGPRRSVRR